MSAQRDLATAERLSAYLDDELEVAERAALERHLDDHPEGRRRLERMRAVIADLRRLEPQPPPALLEKTIAHRVVLERERRSLMDRLDHQLGGLSRNSPILAMFAVVIALALFIYFFSLRIDQAARDDIAVVVVGADARTDAPGGVERIVGTRLEIAGRALFWTGELWREGTVSKPPQRTITFGTDDGEAWVVENPAFEPLRALGETVEIELDGETVRFEPR